VQPLIAWFGRIFLDGIFRNGPQWGCAPGETRAFACCILCNRLMPHWLLSMTVPEVKRRGYVGCKCGGIRIQPLLIPAWKAAWWVLVRGWFIRHLLLRKRLWDPRMPLMYKELT